MAGRPASQPLEAADDADLERVADDPSTVRGEGVERHEVHVLGERDDHVFELAVESGEDRVEEGRTQALAARVRASPVVVGGSVLLDRFDELLFSEESPPSFDELLDRFGRAEIDAFHLAGSFEDHGDESSLGPEEHATTVDPDRRLEVVLGVAHHGGARRQGIRKLSRWDRTEQLGRLRSLREHVRQGELGLFLRPHQRGQS